MTGQFRLPHQIKETQMRTLTLSLGLPLLLLTACGGSEQSDVSAEPTPADAVAEVTNEASPEGEAAPEEEAPPEEVAAFDAAAMYATSCASCHGASGEGDGAAAAGMPVPPANFADSTFWDSRTDEEVANVITNGGAAAGKSPMMVAFGPVLGDNVPAMVEYLHTFNPN